MRRECRKLSWFGNCHQDPASLENSRTTFVRVTRIPSEVEKSPAKRPDVRPGGILTTIPARTRGFLNNPRSFALGLLFSVSQSSLIRWLNSRRDGANASPQPGGERKHRNCASVNFRNGWSTCCQRGKGDVPSAGY